MLLASHPNPSLSPRIHHAPQPTPGEGSQRILNALEPGTELPIHRHRESSETVVMLRGKGRWNYYDDQGNLTGTFLVSADGDIRGISVPKGQWHNTESLESGTVILECKDGPWKPLAEEDILEPNKQKTKHKTQNHMSIFQDKILMITGGTGSFGNAVLKRFLATDIKEIRIFSRDEKKQDDMRHEYQAAYPDVAHKIKFYIGDVRNKSTLKGAMRGVDYIFHATP